MSEHPNGDTPPRDIELVEALEKLAKFDKDAARDLIGDHLFTPAVLALRDGLAYRNKRGLPSRSFVREFTQIVKLAGEPAQLAVQIVAALGMTVEQARPMLEQGQRIQGLDAHELARRAMKSLMLYRSSYPMEFLELCESFNVDVESIEKGDPDGGKADSSEKSVAASRPRSLSARGVSERRLRTGRGGQKGVPRKSG